MSIRLWRMSVLFFFLLLSVAAEELLTVREVARRLRVDDTTIRRWIKSGTLEAILLPHSGKRESYRIKKSTLDALLANPVLPLQEEEHN